MKNTEITQNWFSYVGFIGKKEAGYICPEGKDFVATDYVELRIDPSKGSPLYSVIEYKKEDWMEEHPDASPFIEKDGYHHGNYYVKGDEWTMDESVDRIIAYVHFTHETNEFNTIFFEVGSVSDRDSVELKKYLTEDELKEIIDFAENCMKNDFLKLTENAEWNYAEDAEDLGIIDVPENSVRKWKSLEEAFLYYMVDVDLCTKDYSVIETIKCDLFRSKSPNEVKRFAKKYAKNRNNFDFQYLQENDGAYYEVTIRKYFTENEWDDWDAVRVVNPRKSKHNQIAKKQEKPSLETQLSDAKKTTSKQERHHLTQRETVKTFDRE